MPRLTIEDLMPHDARRRRQLSTLFGVTGLLVLAAELVVNGPAAADNAASILVGVLTLAALVLRRPVHTAEDLVTDMREDGRTYWRTRADRLVPTPEVGLIPVQLQCISEIGARHDPHRGRSAVPLADFRQDWARIFRESLGSRAVVHGPTGVGKTTVAMLATAEMLESDVVPVPVLLGLSSWSPDTESFKSWLIRRLDVAYPATRAIPRKPGVTRLQQVLSAGDVLLILDGLDEVVTSDRAQALRAVYRAVPSRCRLVVLTHTADPADIAETTAWPSSTQHYWIAELPAEQVVDYLTDADGPGRTAPGRQLSDRLRRSPTSCLRDFLTTPLRLHLVLRTMNEGRLTPEELERMVDEAPASDVQDELVRRDSAAAIQNSGYLSRIDTMGYLRQLALMSRQHPVLAWWRISAAVPPVVYYATTSLMAVPAYALTRYMPAGLTRGLAIGLLAGVYLGVLRNVRPASRGLAACAALVVAACVAGVGAFLYPWQQVLADATQLSVAAALVLGARTVLERDSWLRAARAVLGVGLGTAGATSIVSHAIGFDDPHRGFVSILVAGMFGAGVATVSARLLTPSGPALRPSSVQLTRGPRRGWAAGLYIRGLVSAMAVGLGGGLVGAIRFDAHYGLTVGLLFGVMIGVPVGAVGGVIRWLAAPLKNGSGTAHTADLMADRRTAVGSILAIGAAASAAAFLLARWAPGLAMSINGYEQARPFALHPLLGLVFGTLIGIVVAGFISAWPSFVIGHLWMIATGQLPWRLQHFLSELCDVGILRQQDYAVRFRHQDYDRALACPGAHLDPPESQLSLA